MMVITFNVNIIIWTRPLMSPRPHRTLTEKARAKDFYFVHFSFQKSVRQSSIGLVVPSPILENFEALENWI